MNKAKYKEKRNFINYFKLDYFYIILNLKLLDVIKLYQFN